jgi:type VI secretion system protein ImpI
MRLTLVVSNTAALEGGTHATHVFGQEGGVVGSAPDSAWMLADRHGTVDPVHARVFFADGQFCMEAVSPRGILVNGASRPLKPGEPFQMMDGDTLRFGRFDVSAFVTTPLDAEAPGSESDHIIRKFVSVETLIDPADSQREKLYILGDGGSKEDRKLSFERRFEAERDLSPVALINEASGVNNRNIKDPLAALDLGIERNKEDVMSAKVSDYMHASPEPVRKVETPDDFQPGSDFFSPPQARSVSEARIEGARAASATRPEIDAYLAQMQKGATAGPTSVRDTREVLVRDSWLGGVDRRDMSEQDYVDHVVMRPLCQALGLPIRDMTGPEANQLAGDIGEALRATIAGLMHLNRQEMPERSLLAETHLHAIEDNPLRLAADADEAVKDLFMVQSPVHLSARAAIEESLSLLDHHQGANEHAIEAALQAVLGALSPLALARRFMKYKGHAPRTGDLDAWHWRMYQHYYAELASDRQGGLSRMFREVFRQVYDREMRTRTREA